VRRLPPLVCAAALVSACDGDSEVDPSAFVTRGESAHFEYRTQASEDLACTGMMDLLEKHYSVITAYLGTTSPSDRITYLKFEDVTDMRLNDLCMRGACAPGAAVWSYQPVHQHELVHAYLANVGTPPAIFQEGVAVALACDQVDDEMPSLSWDQAVRSNDPLNEHAIYTVGSRLVSHLLRRFGAPAFVQLYARLGHHATPSEVDQAMMAVYGSSAEQLWQDALAAPPGCIPIWACAGDAGAIDGSPLPAGESCGADEDYRTFTSPDAGGVLVSFSARSRLRAGSCDDPGVEPPWLAHSEFINSAAGHIAADIAPGKHYLAFTSSASSIRVQRPPAPITGPECATLQQPIAVGAGEYPSIHVVIPPGQPVWQVKLRLPDPRLLAISMPPDTQLTACRDCDFAAPECTATDPALPFASVVWSGDYALRFARLGDTTSPAQVDIVGR
jgi:hypothetical protein